MESSGAAAMGGMVADAALRAGVTKGLREGREAEQLAAALPSR